MYKLYNGDCLEILRELPNESIDMVVIDPPYKLTSGGCKGNLKIVFNSISEKQKQSGIMFNIPKFNEYFSELFRILKDGTHFYCMCNDKHLKDVLIEGEKAGFKEVNVLVWAKGMHTPLPYYMKNIEFIVLFRKGKARKINNMGSFALIDIKGIRGNKVHPTQKPVELLEYLIKTYTKENEVVLDFTMGSGSTGVACMNTNRKFIGIELDENYFNIAKDRIENSIKNK